MTQFLLLHLLTVRKQGFWHWNYANKNVYSEGNCRTLCGHLHSPVFCRWGGLCAHCSWMGSVHLPFPGWMCLFPGGKRLYSSETHLSKTNLPPPSLSPSLSGENNPITFVSLDQVPGIVCLYTLSHTHTHTPLWVPVPMALSSSICSSWAWTPHLRKHSSVGRAPCSLFPVSRLDLREARNIWKASSESEV